MAHKGVSEPYQLHCWPEGALELVDGAELFIEELLVLATDELLGLDELVGTEELLGIEELLGLDELLGATLDELTTLDELATLEELVPPLLPRA